VTPIKSGTAARLGLRKPTGVYRYRDGSLVFHDEIRIDLSRFSENLRRFADACNVKMGEWQARSMEQMARVREAQKGP
jgi:hypothetical protein